MLYIIGLGLSLHSVNKEALESIKKCSAVYLENYTVQFPYKQKELEKALKKKVILLNRESTELLKFIEKAKQEDIALLVYGSPLIATTHITIIIECVKQNISYRILHNASIIDAVAETGLQIYKFGKIASLPLWTENYKPASFIQTIVDNLSIKAHTLLLVDIGMPFSTALKQFCEACKDKITIDKIIVCSNLGAEKQNFFYNSVLAFENKNIEEPFCFIIPSELHFTEAEAVALLIEKKSEIVF